MALPVGAGVDIVIFRAVDLLADQERCLARVGDFDFLHHFIN
jgi:hypothetical protein